MISPEAMQGFARRASARGCEKRLVLRSHGVNNRSVTRLSNSLGPRDNSGHAKEVPIFCSSSAVISEIEDM